MGSPSARLNVPEHLRPWLESGLEHIFQPGGPGAAEAEAVTPAQAQAQAPQSAPAEPPARERIADTPPSASQARPSAPQPDRQPPAQPNRRPVPSQTSSAPQASVPQGGAGRASRPMAESFREPGNGPAAPAGPAFPEPWASYLKLVAPEHKMVWTYMELGLDLGGQKDDRRRAVAANLIRHLRLPPRPVAFWPVAVLQSGRLVADRELFWRGWRLWKTPHVVCFGQDALRVILPDADPARSMHMLRDVMVHVLPSMGELVSMLPHEQQLAVNALADLRF